MQLEIEERKMKLAERQTADRRAKAEIEKLELEILSSVTQRTWYLTLLVNEINVKYIL